MNKSERTYIAGRIESIAKTKCAEIEKSGPSKPVSEEFIKAAIVEGTAKLRPAKDIIMLAFDSVSKCSRWGSEEKTVTATDLFRPTESFNREMDLWKKATKKNRVLIDRINMKAQQLADAVMSGDEPDGLEAIKAMEEFE